MPPEGKEDRFSVVPEQTGLLLEAVAAGLAFTVAAVVVVLLHPLTVTVTV